jgi:hypothetical protein
MEWRLKHELDNYYREPDAARDEIYTDCGSCSHINNVYFAFVNSIHI